MFVFISLSAKNKDVTKYDWYRFNGKRTARFYNHHKTYDLDIESGDKFGVRAARGFVGLIPEDALDIEFKLSYEEFDKLSGRCVGFSGTVDGKKVTKGLRGKDGKAIPKNKPAPPQPAPRTKPDVEEDKQLTSLVQGLPMGGSKTAMHVHAERVFGRETYHFYDVSSMLKSYQRKHGLGKYEMGNFADELEEMVESISMGDVDAEVGKTKFQGKTIPVLSCLIIED